MGGGIAAAAWKRFIAGCLCLLIGSGLLSGCEAYPRYAGLRIENTDELSEAVRTAMKHRAYRIKITYDAQTFDREAAEELAAKLVDNAFYESDDPAGGDYLRYQYGGYQLTHSCEKGLFRYRYKAEIVPVYYTTSEQEETLDEEIARILEDFRFSQGAADLEKIRRVHDFICERTAYDMVHKHQGSSHIQSTAYGALIYRTALCQGYAVLCYRLLKELGIDCRIVTGEAVTEGKTERHAWNIVRVGDVFYNMDVTFDDVKGTYDWFLKSDRTFERDHTRDERYCSDEFCEQYPMSREDYWN